MSNLHPNHTVIQLEKGKRINLCLERYGNIEMFIVEDVIERSGYSYARIKKITLDTIDSGEVTLKNLELCQVIEGENH